MKDNDQLKGNRLTMTAAVNSSNEITHQPCPFEECASSDAFSYNVVSKVGHCKSCDRGYPNKAKMFDWAKKLIQCLHQR